MARLPAHALYRLHELAFRTQYAELKERSRSAGHLLPGTPGHLVLRDGTGHRYWYRRYYAVPGQAAEDLVCKDGDDVALASARERMAFSDWSTRQVRDLRKLEFQAAEKTVARVLVELHNTGLMAGGLVLVGTLGYMAWLNELGARAVTARTQDIDLARRQVLKLAAPTSFLRTVESTRLRFFPVPGMPDQVASTSVKRPGADGLRVDVLTDGPTLGQVVPVPELEWHAKTVPFYDYLLLEPHEAAFLAGGQCVPVNLPAPERFMWHKLFSAASRPGSPEKVRKDLLQAATLAAVLVEQDDASLSQSLVGAPPEVQEAAQSCLPAMRKLLNAHPQASEAMEMALAGN